MRPAAGALTILCLLLLWLPAARGGGGAGRIETGHCVITHEPQDADAARWLASHADAAVEEAGHLLGLRPGPRITVALTSDRQAFERLQPAGARVPHWAAGVAYAEKNLIVLCLSPGADLLKLFRHEATHILLGRAFGGTHRIPRWLNEGLAMIQAREWNMSRLSTMTFAVLSDSLLPMDSLAQSFPADLRKAKIAYCQSFYFISFLKGEFGPDAFRLFLDNYYRSRDFEHAILSAYRISWSLLEERWLDYLHLRFSWIPILTSSGALWFGAGIIFICSYFRKKRAAARTLRRWEAEERDGGPESL